MNDWIDYEYVKSLPESQQVFLRWAMKQRAKVGFGDMGEATPEQLRSYICQLEVEFFATSDYLKTVHDITLNL